MRPIRGGDRRGDGSGTRPHHRGRPQPLPLPPAAGGEGESLAVLCPLTLSAFDSRMEFTQARSHCRVLAPQAAGGTNITGVCSPEALQASRDRWLRPLALALGGDASICGSHTNAGPGGHALPAEGSGASQSTTTSSRSGAPLLLSVVVRVLELVERRLLDLRI